MLKEIAILTDIICKTALNSITLSDEVLKQKLKEFYYETFLSKFNLHGGTWQTIRYL